MRSEYGGRRAGSPSHGLDKTRPGGPDNRNPAVKGQGRRYLDVLHTGTAEDMRALVRARGGTKEGEHRIVRHWDREQGAVYPTAESFVAAGPAGAFKKTGPGFDSIWAAADTAPIRNQQLTFTDVLGGYAGRVGTVPR